MNLFNIYKTFLQKYFSIPSILELEYAQSL